jgi:hypothetical protein
MWWRVREASDAADLVLDEWERRIDRCVGERTRRTLTRYVSLTLIAVPVAWAGAGFRLDATAGAGCLAGICLYAVIDLLRIIVTKYRRP